MENRVHGTVTIMATTPTRIHAHARGRYYLREHFQASGLRRAQLAGQMGMAPESVSRLMKNADEFHRISAARLQQFADVMGVTTDDLRRPPPPKNQPKPRSLDEMVKDEPEDVRLMFERMIEAYKNRKTG